MLKIERAGDVLAGEIYRVIVFPIHCLTILSSYMLSDTPAKVAQSILLFCKGQGLLTSVVMPGVDRQRAFSTSSGGSNGEPRRLSRGKLIGAICETRKRKLAWSMMMNRILSFSRLLVFSLFHFRFLSRHVHGGVR